MVQDGNAHNRDVDCPKWGILARIWFCLLGVAGVMPWVGLCLELNEKGTRYLKASDFGIFAVVILWDLFLLKLVRSHVKLALLLFDGLNCLIGIFILVKDGFDEDGWLISSFYFGISFVTWLLTRKSLRKDTIRDSIEEIKRS